MEAREKVKGGAYAMVMSDEEILAKNYGPWGNMRKKFLHEYRQAEWGLQNAAAAAEQYPAGGYGDGAGL